MTEHLRVVEECLVVKTTLRVAVNNGCPEEHIGVVGTFEEGNRIVEATERGVRAQELEIQDGVVVEAVAEERGVDLEKVVDGFGAVDKEGDPVY